MYVIYFLAVNTLNINVSHITLWLIDKIALIETLNNRF